MKKDRDNSDKFSKLRNRAEEILRDRPTVSEELIAGETRRLLHELEVHQIELEMQNEELRRVQQELEVSRNKYSDLYDFAPVGYFSVGENGRILETNLTGAAFLGESKQSLMGKLSCTSISLSGKIGTFSTSTSARLLQRKTPCGASYG